MAKKSVAKKAEVANVPKKRGRPPGSGKKKVVVKAPANPSPQIEFDFTPSPVMAPEPHEMMVWIPARLLRDLLNACV